MFAEVNGEILVDPLAVGGGKRITAGLFYYSGLVDISTINLVCGTVDNGFYAVTAGSFQHVERSARIGGKIISGILHRGCHGGLAGSVKDDFAPFGRCHDSGVVADICVKVLDIFVLQEVIPVEIPAGEGGR